MSNRRVFLCALLTGCAAFSSAQAADNLDTERRDAFRLAWAAAERGDRSVMDANEELLRDYVLWPDLEGAWLRARVALVAHDQIEFYLDRHDGLKPARELRYRYALHLAETGRDAEYLAIYRQYYRDLGLERLDCLALTAEFRAGDEAGIVERGLELWRVGHSQVDECDPVFEILKAQGQIDRAEYERRYELAIDERHFSLARYLARNIDAAHVDAASAWLRAQSDPASFVQSDRSMPDTEISRQQLAYAVERIAFSEPLSAAAHWQRLGDRFGFTAETLAEVDRHIALWAARQRYPEAGRMLGALPESAVSTESGRWLVRAMLLGNDWDEAVRGIDALPARESGRDEWQFWRAVGLENTEAIAESAAILRRLALNRDYYGFLAADEIDAEYAMTDERLPGDPETAARLQKEPALIRARELFLVGLDSRGRSEWDDFVNGLTADEQVQAARIAHEWGWHSRAISTVASAGHFDDLQLRYPLPWQETFAQFAETEGVETSLAYGIARSESLFMRDIRSSAGAIGVMQLMPATGRDTARELKIPWTGSSTLVDPTTNIRLGTRYLGQMLSRFDRHAALAAAAYNAGPERVMAWLPVSGDMDARIWIENIPFNETRSYVRRVLADKVVFDWRLNGATKRVGDTLAPVANSARVAAAIATD